MNKKKKISIHRGYAKPFGANVLEKGINFSLYTDPLPSVILCLYDTEQKDPFAKIPLSPTPHQTGYIWHAYIENLTPPVNYAYLIGSEKKKGTLLVHDPWTKTLATPPTWRDHKRYTPLGQILPKTPFHWDGDSPLNTPIEELIIYEMHVRGFTIDHSSHVKHPGTFLGIIEKISYLLDLGINAIELMPIFEFNENQHKQTNFWGYSPVNFFCPMRRFAHRDPTLEFKTMVKELHKNGIEVILDTPFNHTAEEGTSGPAYSFKGLAPSTYYLKSSDNKFIDFTGCKNTIQCYHPITQEFILSYLQWWVTEMHVDGFRFDLAPIMKRGADGALLTTSPLLEQISSDPILADTKLIAEPWDLQGANETGSFFPKSERWGEWNGQFRDTIRSFIKGTLDDPTAFWTRIMGSPDLYPSTKCSINYITCHDGFTLADLVTYHAKSNWENGENNRDGMDENHSWNCGAEGPTTDPHILSLRERQMRNFHLALMIARGIPMLRQGDEYGHTCNGNNNPWCQDNALNWFLWDNIPIKKNFFRFYRGLIHLRRQWGPLHDWTQIRDGTAFAFLMQGTKSAIAFIL